MKKITIINPYLIIIINSINNTLPKIKNKVKNYITTILNQFYFKVNKKLTLNHLFILNLIIFHIQHYIHCVIIYVHYKYNYFHIFLRTTLLTNKQDEI